MSHWQVVDPDGWVRTVLRVDWRLVSWQPFQATVKPPDSRGPYTHRAWTEEGAWRVTEKVKARLKGGRRRR